ncbi:MULTISPECIES: hypothetical protein [Actinosynnema]|uniref:hypothetical protein n=1 Tax=Actinosynnema TaxID=40566 RepID=UPI0020A358C1|nr:hypothetical protein [Actinosynnema pretiosum]MCP2092777.1 hypothetical protein [Actinosynnema pretiosum]
MRSTISLLVCMVAQLVVVVLVVVGEQPNGFLAALVTAVFAETLPDLWSRAAKLRKRIAAERRTAVAPRGRRTVERERWGMAERGGARGERDYWEKAKAEKARQGEAGKRPGRAPDGKRVRPGPGAGRGPGRISGGAKKRRGAGRGPGRSGPRPGGSHHPRRRHRALGHRVHA